MNEDTQKKGTSEKKELYNGGSSIAADIGLVTGGFLSGIAAANVFSMTDDGSSEIQTIIDPDEPIEPEPDDDDDVVITTVVDDDEQPQQDNGLPHYTDAPVAHVSDSLSFAHAFAEARQQVGPGGIFEWHGHVYGTYYENEWNSMSQEQRNDYWASVHPEAAHDEEWNPPNQNVVSNNGGEHPSNGGCYASNLTPSNGEFIDPDEPQSSGEVIAIEKKEDGTFIEMRINGHLALAVDKDNDGVIEYIVEDENGDGKLDASELNNNKIPALLTVADIEEKAGQSNVADSISLANVNFQNKTDYNSHGHISDSNGVPDDDDHVLVADADTDDDDNTVDIETSDDDDCDLGVAFNDSDDIDDGLGDGPDDGFDDGMDDSFDDGTDIAFDDGMDDMMDDYYDV